VTYSRGKSLKPAPIQPFNGIGQIDCYYLTGCGLAAARY